MFDFINGIGEKAIEDMFMKILKDFSENDLQAAVKGDVSLLLLTEQNNPKLLRMASGLARKFRGQKQHFTFQNLMQWLEGRRPDLYSSVIIDVKKKAWIENQIDSFRQFLFEKG